MKLFQQQQQNRHDRVVSSAPLQQQKSWGAIAVGAGTAIAGAFSANASKKAAKAGQADPIKLSDVTADAIRTNNQLAPEAEALSRRTNEFNQAESLRMLEMAVPGYGNLAKQLSGIAGESLANPYALPEEFSANLERLAAERGISTGVRGEAGDFSLLRDFGINSLEFGQQRIGQAQGIMTMLAGLGKVNPLSPLSFYATGDSALAAASGNQALQQSALNARAAGAAQAQSTWGQTIGAIGGIYGGYLNNQTSKNTTGGFKSGMEGSYDADGGYVLPEYTVTAKR